RAGESMTSTIQRPSSSRSTSTVNSLMTQSYNRACSCRNAALPRNHGPLPPTQRLAEVFDVRDQHLPPAPADELDGGVDLRAHRARGELALGEVALGVGDVEAVQELL